jgi:hypothetical protein
MTGKGKKLPKLEGTLGDGTTLSLSSLQGRWIVVFFYPKDNTPGCTNEAKDFRDLYDAFRARNAEVIGVSRDSVRSTRTKPGARRSTSSTRRCSTASATWAWSAAPSSSIPAATWPRNGAASRSPAMRRPSSRVFHPRDGYRDTRLSPPAVAVRPASATSA